MSQTNSTKVNFISNYLKAQTEEQSWTLHNGAIPYQTDIVTTLKLLAENVFPNDSYNSVAYQEAIINAISGTLSEEVGIIEFWKKMGEQGCKSVSVMSGHLQFFQADNSEISITPYTKKIVFEAQSSFAKERARQRNAKIAEAKSQIAALKAQLAVQLF